LPGIDLQGLIGNEALDLGMLANAKLTPPPAMDRKQLKAMNKALEQYAMSSADYQLVTAEKEDGCALSANAGFWGGIKKNGSENAYDLPISEKAELSKGIKYPISIGKRLEGTLLIQGETEKVPISMILCEASTGKEVDPKRYSIFLKSIGANWSALKINVHSPGEYTVRLFHVGDGDEKRGSISRWAITSSEKSFWESVHQVMTYLRVECAKAKLIPLRFGKEIWE
jgi:hypothetical protein